jgi:hypothetical protein
MTAKRQSKATGITHAPLKREEEEQEKVPPQGESTIGKGRNRKAPPSETEVYQTVSQKEGGITAAADSARDPVP